MICNFGGFPAATRLARRPAHHRGAFDGDVEDMNAVELLPGGGLGHRPAEVFADRREADGAIWMTPAMTATAQLGLVHRRRIYVAARRRRRAGRGHAGGPGRAQVSPSASTSTPRSRPPLVQEGSGVLIRLPGRHRLAPARRRRRDVVAGKRLSRPARRGAPHRADRRRRRHRSRPGPGQMGPDEDSSRRSREARRPQLRFAGNEFSML